MYLSGVKDDCCDSVVELAGLPPTDLSGVRRKSAVAEPALDSRFFKDSFFSLAALLGAGLSCVRLAFDELGKSGLSGEETVGVCSSSSARFCGIVGA